MADFIQGDNFERIGGQAEEKVWKRIKEALNKRDILGYSRYPLFLEVGQRRKEPDILLLDKELGIIIIEVKGYTIDNIVGIDANEWRLEGIYAKTVNPIAQAEDYLYSLKGKFDIDRNLRNRFRGQYFVALPNINKSQWMERGFNKIIDDTYLIFQNELSKNALIEKIKSQESLIGGTRLNNETFKIAKSILGHENTYIDEVKGVFPEGSKCDIYNSVLNKVYDLDIQQEQISKQLAPGPQRIRGIAGSGKTILICQKAAIMHIRYPEWKIAVVFFTQSLYDNIIGTIDRYLKYFSNGKVYYDEENSNLQVLHAWGRKDRNGFYKEIVNINNCRFRSASDVNNEQGYLEANNSINYISKKLLEETNGNLAQVYDAILIDEGQDLIGDEQYKYQGKQSFYYMVYESLKPINDNGLRRLIWAYDELQSLNDKKIPSSKEIFGDNTLVQGKYKGGINKSEVMKKCYRTPYQILTAAHAIGMGIFRKKGLISGYTRKEEWEKVGYEVIEGDFKKEGNTILLRRLRETSPNPIEEYFKGNSIELNTFKSEYDMIKELAKNIKNDISIEKLNPSRDILIVDLKGNKNRFEEEIGIYLKKLGINFYIPAQPNMNQHTCDWRYKKPDKFWCDNAVTISQTPRAKGNEAPMVYVVGIEQIAENEQSIKERNKLFTAITRAKCWVKLMGVGNYELYDEIDRAISSNGKFEFKFTKPKKETDDI